MHITQVMGGVQTDCAEICCAARDPLTRLFAKVHDGAQLHVRTPFPYLENGCTCAPLLRISETAGRIALKFGMFWYMAEAH